MELLKRNKTIWGLILILGLSSCAVMETPKYKLSDGYFKTSAFISEQKKVYIDTSEDTIFVYRTNQLSGTPDTVTGKHNFPQIVAQADIKSAYFRQASFDLDFLTIPFKYRPKQSGLPQQFNTNLNGAVYLGYRDDIYHLSYGRNPLSKYQRQISHYGISYGLFTGFGSSAMNPSVTNNRISTEYDGLVWGKGVAGIIGINNFTIGLAVGFDNLLDKNKKVWIYQGKPWLGLAFGLNLN
jgi:hypothetical protein